MILFPAKLSFRKIAAKTLTMMGVDMINKEE